MITTGSAVQCSGRIKDVGLFLNHPVMTDSGTGTQSSPSWYMQHVGQPAPNAATHSVAVAFGFEAMKANISSAVIRRPPQAAQHPQGRWRGLSEHLLGAPTYPGELRRRERHHR
jgi:hypothetical protein